MKNLIELSDGNPGALTCLLGMLNGGIENSVAGIIIIPTIESLNIKGSDLYVFWSDLCDKDYQKMKKLCMDCPHDILKDACSRQDYSGKELVKSYL